MFNNPQSFNPKDQETIYSITQLITQLKEKNSEWKSMKTKYLDYHPKAPFPESPLLVNEPFLRKLGHVMKRARIMNIQICSKYISLLYKAIKCINKQSFRRTNDLQQILHILKGLYCETIESEVISDLKELHEMEFKDALRIKKRAKEFYQKIQSWDVGWLDTHGYEYSYLKHPTAINNTQEFFARFGNYSNWRKDTLVNNEFRKVLRFKEFIENIIKEYESILIFY